MGGWTERYDVWTRFARVHLSTPAERAVYRALVGATQASWSAEEIAGTQHLDTRNVEGILVRFVDAGIAEQVKGDQGRYRWRAELDYIFGDSGGAQTPPDPVCGMLAAEDSPLVAQWEGRRFTFCSSLCRAAFLAFPASFAPAAERPGFWRSRIRQPVIAAALLASVNRLGDAENSSRHDVPQKKWVTPSTT